MFWRPSEKVQPDQWAAKHRIYPETAGVPGPRDPTLTPYMIPFGRAIAAGDYPRVVGVTGAQSGKTDTFLDIIGHRLDLRPAPILYVGPSQAFNEDQFEPRLMGLIDEAATLAGKILRGRVMKKALKRIAGVRVRLAHAGSSTALKSDPAALALIDEYDEMMANVRGQGDVLGLVEARGDTYADFITGITSTTSIGRVETEVDEVSGLEFWKVGDPEDIESQIWRLWQEGTRYHWAWPCPHCDEYFIPRFKCMSWPENATPTQARRDTVMICPHNGCVIHNDDKAGMNERGLMIAPGQWIEGDKVKGAPPDSRTASFWTSGFCSPFVSWGDRIWRYLTAVESGDTDRIQTATNAGFGELYMPFERGDLPSTDEIMDRPLPYRTGEIVPEGIRFVAGVDVQKNSLYYVQRAFGGRGTSWLVNYGQIFGATADDDVWHELADMLLTPVDGLRIERMMIDSGYRPDKPDGGDIHKVYEFCRRYPSLAIPCKGKDIAAVPIRFNQIEVTARGKKTPISIRLAHLDSDFFKSLVHSRLKIPIDEPGALQMPFDLTEDYAKQIVSEVRVVNRGERPYWAVLNRENHYLDCEALAAAGGYLLNVQRIPEGVTREVDRTAASIPSVKSDENEGAAGAPSRDPDPDPPAPKPGVGTGDIRARFANRSANLR